MSAVEESRISQSPRISYGDFLEAFKWRQGEHVCLIGPTGCGKTTVINNVLIPRRKWEIFLGSKRFDETQDDLKRLGFVPTEDPATIHPEVSRKWYVKPPFNPAWDEDKEAEIHRKVYQETLRKAFNATAWTIFVDEARYLSSLNLQKAMVRHLTQGRSQGNSMVMGTQRPRFIPLEAYDQSTHLFFWKDPDLQNVKRVAEMAGVNQRHAMTMVSRLENDPDEGWGEFLYYNTRTGYSCISQVEGV